MIIWKPDTHSISFQVTEDFIPISYSYDGETWLTEDLENTFNTVREENNTINLININLAAMIALKHQLEAGNTTVEEIIDNYGI